MKNYILIFIFLLFSKFLLAQSYIPFQFGNTRWMYNEIKMFSTKSFCYFSFDTSGYYHNGNKFWKIEYVLNPTYSPSNIYRYVYDDTIARKIYTIDTISNTTFLLYDFSANVGDTINSVYNVGYLDTVVVDSINYISINTILRKHIYVHSKNNVNLSKTWIEGIGSTYELFYPSIHLPDPVYELICQEYNTFINFGTNLGCSNFITTTKYYNILDNQIAISFNPDINSIHIENPNSLTYSFYIYDFSGKVIEQLLSARVIENIDIGHISDVVVLYNLNVKSKINKNGKIIRY